MESERPIVPEEILEHHTILIIGGGTAGITVAARLLRKLDEPDIAIIEPREAHYYQPLWTLVGGGVFPKEESYRLEEEVMPEDVAWIRDKVTEVHPDQNYVVTASGNRIGYDYLVVAPGIKIDWDKIEGLPETLSQNGVCSIYSYRTVDYVWQCLQTFKGGRAIFTSPGTPIKCGGAPQKIMYLASDYFQRHGVKASVELWSAGTTIFGVKEYKPALEKVLARYQIQTHFYHELIAIDGKKKEAVFEYRHPDEPRKTVTVPFDMIHVVPPQSAPDFIKQSPLANAEGWVDVDHFTLQHTRYPNVFGIGDAAGLPTAKTGAAVRKQAPVLVENLTQYMKQGAITQPARYDGYSSCPIVTGYGRLLLCEFEYENKFHPTIPLIDTTKERYSMWLLKKYGLPFLYWNLMLKGLA